MAPCPPRPCHRNSTKPFSFMELTSLEYGHRLCPEVRRPVGRAGKEKSLRPCNRTKATLPSLYHLLQCTGSSPIHLRALVFGLQLRRDIQTSALLPSGSHHPRIAAGFRRSYCLHHRHCDWLCLIEDIIRTGRGLVKAQIPLFSRKKGPFLVRYSCPAWPEKIQGAGCTSISSFRPTLETSSCITSVGWMPFSQSIPGIRLMKLNSKV